MKAKEAHHKARLSYQGSHALERTNINIGIRAASEKGRMELEHACQYKHSQDALKKIERGLKEDGYRVTCELQKDGGFSLKISWQAPSNL